MEFPHVDKSQAPFSLVNEKKFQHGMLVFYFTDLTELLKCLLFFFVCHGFSCGSVEQISAMSSQMCVCGVRFDVTLLWRGHRRVGTMFNTRTANGYILPVGGFTYTATSGGSSVNVIHHSYFFIRR